MDKSIDSLKRIKKKSLNELHQVLVSNRKFKI